MKTTTVLPLTSQMATAPIPMGLEPQQKAILLLADDDIDDCLFFKEALEELPVTAELTTVRDGEQLMEFLADETIAPPPHILFLDLNMPRKNGYECLEEIKLDERLRALAVIIFSTSFDPNVIKQLYTKGAQYYIRKPADFSKLKQVIYQALMLASQNNPTQPSTDDFVIKADIDAIQL